MNVVLELLGLLVALAIAVAVRVVATFFWLFRAVVNLSEWWAHWRLARSTHKSPSTSICPRGHTFETDGLVCECEACGFLYEGSVWLCPNPECPAPVTNHIGCPTCSLSARSPYRLGRS